ncbi:MAG: tungsten ABC transporter substrate-binding protein [Firmicutes bacterium HGW-Firmicutes-7]|nr:MAG: tungsten ABC transporter substrate-binding protein [Firmicutes bacterium HGW-Firmicutes-7]
MNYKKSMLVGLIISVLVLSVIVGCTNNKIGNQILDKPEAEDVTIIEDNGSIILATTTSTQDSGLLDYILPRFKEETGIEAKVVAVGTGKAIQMGVDGEADVLLVHAKSSEEEFVKSGHADARFDVMYNDFVLIGPENDPAGLVEKGDVISALALLSEGNYVFVSRGDDSGTHKKELGIWKDAKIEPVGDWYISAGKGMGDVIQMADEMVGYTLCDRATYLAMRDNVDLKIVVESDLALLNQYGVMAVNPNKNKEINGEGAMTFVDWILSEKTQKLIGEYGKEEFGQALFIPNAKK